MSETSEGKAIADLGNPEANGVAVLKNFISSSELDTIQEELGDPQKVKWRDTHESYQNKRGLTIVQNHDTYALRLSSGDQSPLKLIPAINEAARRTRLFTRGLSAFFPSLHTWEPDEMSLHRYDDQEVGLSKHRDNARFTGLIAITSLGGECDLAIYPKSEDEPELFPTEPGDLVLLRGSDLVDSDQELRPEHAILNLRTPTRTSMMLRANDKPDELVGNFKFDN